MNLANIGTLNGDSCMAYSVKERKCPMSFFKGKTWQRKLLNQFLFYKTNHEEWLFEEFKVYIL